MVFIVVSLTIEQIISEIQERNEKDYLIGQIIILVSYMQVVLRSTPRTLGGSVKLPNE